MGGSRSRVGNACVPVTLAGLLQSSFKACDLKHAP